jgi:hypothetical protein
MIGFPAAPRYAEAVKRLTGDEDLVPPGLTLESDRPEWSYIKREGLGITDVSIGATVGQFGILGLANPIGSKMLLVVTGAAIVTISNQVITVNVFTGAPPVGSSGVGMYRDSRWRSWATQVGTIIQTIGGTLAAKPGIPVWRYQALANQPIQLLPWFPFVVAPGSQLMLVNSVVNEVMAADFAYSVRPATPEELAE